mmetsp:Transcript_11240/g.31745  ORF Transcript_11240/g.31745 Transcript_11240/m.31745 type:complete len:443 (+) Transcript_11240:2838-4166(+)
MKGDVAASLHLFGFVLRGSFAIGDGRVGIAQTEHGLHINQSLSNFSVDRTDEVERDAQLEQEAVHQHQISHGGSSRQDVAAGQIHNTGETRGKDGVLSKVEQRQRTLRLESSLLIARQPLLVLLHLVRLVVEVLDGLVVEQTVHHPARGLVLQPVHVPPELRPPLGNPHRVGRVRPDGRQDHRRVGGPEVVRHQSRHDANLQGRRDDVEDHGVQHEADRAVAPIQHPAELAGVAREMELHVEGMDVVEDRPTDAADGILRDVGEGGVAQLLHPRGRGAGEAVAEEEAEGEGGGRGGRFGRDGGREDVEGCLLLGQRIDQRFEHERYLDGDGLATDHEAQAGQDPPLHVGGVLPLLLRGVRGGAAPHVAQQRLGDADLLLPLVSRRGTELRRHGLPRRAHPAVEGGEAAVRRDEGGMDAFTSSTGSSTSNCTGTCRPTCTTTR